MSKKLVIVESKGKINKISKYLGNDYIIMASDGHILDLKKTSMSVNLDTFEPEYEINDDKKKFKIKEFLKIIKDIKQENVILASDLDREGEFIAWSLARELKLNNPKRIVFIGITKNELEKAIKNVKTIDLNMVYAQQTRRIIDRFAGFLISNLFSKVGINARSAGRVQSIVVKLIVDKENEINNFLSLKKETYFVINCLFQLNILNINTLNTKLMDKKQIINVINDDDDENNNENNNDNKTRKIFTKQEEEIVINILKKMSKSTYNLLNITENTIKSNPPPPFTTSTMQQFASYNLKFNATKTMEYAQKLYESGYITYMRTDSTNILPEALEEIKQQIIANYGIEYYKKTEYINKKNNTQEAHECIHPTDITLSNINDLTIYEQKLYNCIWKRTIQSQMKPAQYQNINIEIDIDKLPNYKLVGTLKNLVFSGYLIVDNKNPNQNYSIEKLKLNLNNLIWNSIDSTEEIQKPPTRYNEASLIDKISPKHLNIGRPSTNAYIINKIQTQKYVEIQNITGKTYTITNYNVVSTNKKIINIDNKNIIVGEEKNKFVPTDIGIKVVEFLNNYFVDLMDYNFTAKMEKNLDKIALGKINGISIIKPFYEYLTEQIKLIKIIIPQNIKMDNIIGNYNNNNIILKDGKFGKFIIYDNKNYNLSKIKSLPENKTEFLNEIIELIKNPIQPNYIKKFENKTYNYLIKKGEFGFYIQEENIKSKKTKNYNFDFIVKKIASENNLNIDTQINNIMDKIELKNITEQIKYFKSK